MIFEVSTRDYAADSLLIKKAMSHMETLTGHYNGYAISAPSSKFGWTFFKMSLGPELEDAIRTRFADMIGRYSWGSQNEKFTKFMNDYFRSKGCNLQLKKIQDRSS